jgi:hypothetical protein
MINTAKGGGYMASDIKDITIQYEEDDTVLVKELDKEILSKGAWTTILFRYQQWDQKTNEYGPERYSIRRYRKVKDEYRQQSKFTISSIQQAQKIIETLQKWMGESGEE